MAFDLMHLDGHDLRDEPCQVRRGRLEALIHPGGRIQSSDNKLSGTTYSIFGRNARNGLPWPRQSGIRLYPLHAVGGDRPSQPSGADAGPRTAYGSLPAMVCDTSRSRSL